MTKTEFTSYSRKLNMSLAGAQYLEEARSSEPSRPVRSHVGNVVTRIPSAKMGHVVATESKSTELPYAYTLEHDDDVLEYYDQPPRIKLSYSGANGKNVGVRHTPDFLVIRESKVVLVECKPEAKLEELSVSHPDRFQRDEKGRWVCPPGQEAAQALGFDYIIVTDADFNPVVIANLRFLADHSPPKRSALDNEKKKLIQALVQAEPGILFSELMQREPTVTNDDMFRAVGHGDIFVDLTNRPISDYLNVELFPNEAVWKARQALAQEGFDSAHRPNDSKSPADSRAFEILTKASPEDLKTAVDRKTALFPADDSPPANIRPRTLSRWLKSYNDTKIACGYGLIGLLPNWHKSGNRTPQLPKKVYEIFEISYDDDYATHDQPNKKQAHGQFALRCEKAGCEPACYSWYADQLERKSTELTTLRRKGKRAAYQLQGPVHPTGNGSHQGEYPFDVALVDHTRADVELIDAQTGVNLGRPWISVMIDDYSRRVLAIHITFDAPRY